MGSAQTALGKYERAWEDLSIVADEMDCQSVIHDWYCRILLESGITELWLAKGDLLQARFHAEQFLTNTQATAERTWQALAWEASAGVGIAELDTHN
jgi:hypothetical protein